MDKQTHIDLAETRLAGKNLSIEELEHLAGCDFCVEQLADYIENQELLTAPRYLQHDILARSRQFEVRIVAKSNQVSKKLQLFYYTLKVGFAAVFAIAFLVIAPSLTQPAFQTRTTDQKSFFSLYEGIQQITDRLDDFANQLYHHNWEVISDDKQEK